MGRQKEIAKKRRFEEGSSSRAPTCNDDQAPEEDDSLLGTRVLCALNPEQLALVDHYKMRKLIGRKYLDLGILQEFGCNLSVVQLLRHQHWGKKYTYSVDELPLVLRLYTRDEMGNLAFCSYRPNFYTDRKVSNYWKNITGNCAYHSSNLHANEIKENHLKAIRIALAINLSGRTTNLNKAYRQDLFYMWNMERNELVNMELCHALGLEAKLAREKIEARMVAILIPEFVSMGLRLGGDAVEENVNKEEQEEQEEDGGADAEPQGMPNVTDWESMRAFQLHIHQEQMAL
nr:hypothetical protein Iba_chr13dCG6430 [Ipomoea batatas]